MSKNRVCLIVIDGWGINDCESEQAFNAIENSETPLMDTFCTDILHQSATEQNAASNASNMRLLEDGSAVSGVRLYAHGLHVGLPDKLMGNSEVGHLNIGAGRIVYQDIVRIEKSISDKILAEQGALKSLISRWQQQPSNTVKRVHMIGLVSDGGVHSHMNHLIALLDLFEELKGKHAWTGLQIFIHFIGDGRDTCPTSAQIYMRQLLDILNARCPSARLASVCGRYYAMDRDKRWERTHLAYDMLVDRKGKVVPVENIVEEIETRHHQGETDEFLKPIVIENVDGAIKDDDTLLFFNYRSDRMRQIVSCFLPPSDSMHPHILPITRKNLTLLSMTQFNLAFDPWVGVISPPQSMKNVLAEWIAHNNLSQCHIAETEKYAHVTFFFNGGVEAQFPQEERILVASPKVATYDLQPEMSCLQVADQVISQLENSTHPLVLCNLAPPDMVGHTGHYEATREACHQTDVAIAKIWEACKKLGIYLAITSDHGNAEKMKDMTSGKPHTAHTTNQVPFILASPKALSESSLTHLSLTTKGVENPSLCDVAPTLIRVLGLPLPTEMTGFSLLKE